MNDYILYLTKDNRLMKKVLQRNPKDELEYIVTIPERHFILCAFVATRIARIPYEYLTVEEQFWQEYNYANINISAMNISAFRGENETFSFKF